MKNIIRKRENYVGISYIILLLCLVGGVCFGVVGGVSCIKVSAAGKVFTFNGKNLDKFNGEKTFVINCDTTTADADEIYELYNDEYKKFEKVTKVVYGPKATKVKEDFLIYFMKAKTLVLGKNIKQAGGKYNLTYYGSPLLDYYLERIEVKKGNKKYTAKNGVLYNKDMTTLVKLPGNYKGKSYVMPETVQSVLNQYSIVYGRNLEEFTISRICNGNFDNLMNFVKLKSINVVEGNPHFSTMDGVLYNQAQTKMICVPAKLQGTQLHFPDTLTKLELFSLPKELEKINIPRDCKKLYYGGDELEDSNPLFYLKKLQEITVSAGNTSFMAKDGVLFTYDGVTLIAYPAAKPEKEYVVPDEVVTIADDAISDKCKNLERLVIGKKVKYWNPEGDEDDLPQVAEFVVAPENINFCSDNGVLYTKDKKSLLGYPKKSTATSFTFPNETERIDIAFESDYLANITIVSSKIGAEDFASLNAYCLPNLQSFSVTGSASKKYKVVDGVLYNKDTLLSYPAQRKNATFRMPDFVKDVMTYSIVYNSYLKKIVLGRKVRRVDTYAMGYGCKQLTSYGVDKKNKYFSVKNGILYNKKKTTLEMYPFGKKAKTLTILKSVKEINLYSAFFTKTPLKHFKLQKGNSYFKLNKKRTKLTDKEYGIVYNLNLKDIDAYTEFESNDATQGGTLKQGGALKLGEMKDELLKER
ncbi:MAG: hypothetical protein J6D02_08545 [Lachnospira sp.]|nr:hypothetical protein [Lachnospira sp.]